MQYRSVSILALAILALAACATESDGGSAPASAAVIEAFTATPASIEPGAAATLSWRTRHATSIAIRDGAGRPVELGGAPAHEGSVEVLPEATTTYTLRAEGPGGIDERELRVEVIGTPEIELFSASPARLSAGDETRLLWTVRNAERLVIRADDAVLFDEEVEVRDIEGRSTGSFPLTPERTTTYSLEAHAGSLQATATFTVEVEPVIDLFEVAAEGPFALGANVPLRWETRGATSLVLSNGEEEVEIPAAQHEAGTWELPAPAGGVFSLVARSDELETEAEARTVVLPLPRIVRFELPERVAPAAEGETTITVSWEAENADRVFLIEEGGEPIELGKASGERELTIEETKTFILRVENAIGSDERQRTVELVAPARILSFVATPAAVLPGDAVTLSWEVENAASLRLTRNGEEIELPAGATSFEDRPTVTSTYTLTVRDLADQVEEASREVIVTETLVTASLQATPEALAEGEELTLRWKVVTAVEPTPIVLSLRDDQDVHYDLAGKDPREDALVIPAPAGTRTFLLDVEALGATARAEATVVVAPAPKIVLASNPPALHPTEPVDEVELQWTTENAVSLALFRIGSGGAREALEAIPAAEVEEGSLVVSVTGATRFEAEAVSADGVRKVESYTLTFGEPVIHSFTASATEVAPGTEVTFEWDTDYGVVSFEGVRSDREEKPLPFLDIDSLGAQPLSLSDCGGECGTLSFPSGFRFPYFDDVFTTAWVSIHGFIAWEPLSWLGTYYFDGYCLGSHTSGALELAIAPYWGDFYEDEPGSGVYWAQGIDIVGRSFVVIEWRELTHFWDDGIATFQLVLWEDGTFDYRYGPMIGDDVNGDYGLIGHVDTEEMDFYEFICEEMIPGGLTNRSLRHHGPPPAEGSAGIVVETSGDYELCVQGYAGREKCETISITVSP